ncbi:MAG: RNA polymerase sigma factor [Bacillota bacterium]
MVDWTDSEVVAACRRGRPEGFAQLLLRYQERVYRRAYSFLHVREDALDLTQDVFLRVIEALPRFEEGRPLWPWLRRITTNLCLNRLRSNPALVSLDEAFAAGDDSGPVSRADLLAADADVPQEALGNLFSDDLRRALAALPPLHRMAVVLRHQEDLSYEDIARHLDLPLGTVKTYLFRARRALRESLAASWEG